jgi:hypothetical protein
MDNEILVAVLALLGTLIGSLSGILTANRLTNFRIAQLEEKQNKFNNVIERTYKLEEEHAVMDTRILSQELRISDLESDVKNIKAS